MGAALHPPGRPLRACPFRPWHDHGQRHAPRRVPAQDRTAGGAEAPQGLRRQPGSPTDMNDLYSFFVQRRNTRPMHRWHHYFEVYERLFQPMRDRNITLLEIGVQGGGSLEMWRAYFGDSARIYSIDIDPNAKRNEDIATRVFIGDQADRQFLRDVRRQIGTADIIIDDG